MNTVSHPHLLWALIAILLGACKATFASYDQDSLPMVRLRTATLRVAQQLDSRWDLQGPGGCPKAS
jgi:hypothetical protein